MEGQEVKHFAQRRDSSENNYHYYSEYKRLHEQSVILSHHIKKIDKRQQKLLGRINQLVQRAENFRDIIRPESSEFRKKKNRRMADEIHKEYVCPETRCGHKYGTQASLRIHIKKKHPERYQPKKRGKAPRSQSLMEQQS